MMYTGDLGNDTLRQIELYGCSFIVEMGDTQTNQTIWTGHVVDGKATAFLQEPKNTTLST